MSFNIVFKFYKDTIIISKIKKEVDEKSLNNTNIIDVKDLKFSNEYIKENFELVSNFLNVAIIKNNINNVQINNMEIAILSMELINEWDHVEKIIFKPDKRIPHDVFIKLLENKSVKYVDCYEINPYLVERIDLNKNLKIKTRHKYNFESNFMKINLLSSYSEMYYKKMIVIEKDFNEIEIEDFKTFMTCNNRLKLIKIVNYSNELLTTIIEEIIKYRKKNIRIEIIEKNNDLNVIYNTINYLKRINRKYFEEYNITFKLEYSKEYKKNNFFKEVNFKFFSAILIFVIIASAITIGINYYIQFNDQDAINTQLVELDRIVDEAEEFKNIDANESDVQYIDVDGSETTTTTKRRSNYSSAYYTNYSQVFSKLLKKNKDTVGWLEVNNTKIKYPVVQSNNNTYYLNHDFNKKKNSMGWIVMDYRNDTKDFDQNTIIYGHNIKTGIMFGTLKYTLNPSWYKKPSNQIIIFNTPEKNMKWQIFSIYKVGVTEDYLKTNFDTDKEYKKFIKMLKKRSIHNFNVDVNENSKILTLSTCFTHTTRNVVHAVLIEDDKSDDEENKEEKEKEEENKNNDTN